MLQVPFAAALSMTIVVARTPEAEDCPDTEHFAAEVARMTAEPRSPRDPMSTVRVSFNRTSEGYEAKVQLEGARQGVRLLRDPSTTCAAVAEAASMTTSMLLDETSAPTAPAGETREDSDRWFQLWGAGRLGGAIGLLGGPNALVGGAVDALLGARTSISLSGVMTSTDETELGRGHVDARLWFVELGAFRSFTRDDVWKWGPAVALMVGEMRGVGEGYPMSSPASITWIGLGGGLRTDLHLGQYFRIGARALAVAPLRKPTFSVGYVGTTETSHDVAAMAEFVAAFRIW